MKNKEATERFQEADTLYRAGDYAQALENLESINDAFPGERRILYPLARCYARMDRDEEALAICERLIDDFDFDKAVHLKKRIASKADFRAEPVDDLEELELGELEENEDGEESRFRVKPVRLALLVLIVLAVYLEWMPLWLGIAMVACYFAVRMAISIGLRKLFETPFKMKAKALANAEAEVHVVTPTEAPRHDSDYDDEGEATGPRNWYWIDVTITPTGKSEGFQYWEPGELALADQRARIRTLDDLDDTYAVREVLVLDGDQELEWDGSKYGGPMRLKLHVGLPRDMQYAQFVYYTEAFGDVRLS